MKSEREQIFNERKRGNGAKHVDKKEAEKELESIPYMDRPNDHEAYSSIIRVCQDPEHLCREIKSDKIFHIKRVFLEVETCLYENMISSLK